ncbi:MAG: ABC transporter permease [Ilumatobacteraceae bacterium]
MALVFGALIGGSSDASFDIGVVDAGGTASTAQLAASLTGDAQAGNVTFAAYDDRAAAAGAVDDGDLNAAIVITADGDRPSFEVLRSSDRLVSGQIGTAVARSLAARTDLVYLTIAADTAVSGTAPTAAEVDRLAAASPGGTTRLELDDTGAGKGSTPSPSTARRWRSCSCSSPSASPGTRSSPSARAESSPGSSPARRHRARSSSANRSRCPSWPSPGSVMVWLVTSLAFGARWGNATGVLLVIAATVAALGGVATFVAAFARTQQQADMYVSAVTFTFALLGGNFVGPDAPPLLATLSKLTPNGWALGAFTDLLGRPDRAGRRARPRRRVARLLRRVRGGGNEPSPPRIPGMSRVRAVYAFVAAVMKSLVRDRTSMFFMAVLPVVVIVVIGTTYGGTSTIRLGIVAPPGSTTATALRDRLADEAFELSSIPRSTARPPPCAAGSKTAPSPWSTTRRCS